MGCKGCCYDPLVLITHQARAVFTFSQGFHTKSAKSLPLPRSSPLFRINRLTASGSYGRKEWQKKVYYVHNWIPGVFFYCNSSMWQISLVEVVQPPNCLFVEVLWEWTTAGDIREDAGHAGGLHRPAVLGAVGQYCWGKGVVGCPAQPFATLDPNQDKQLKNGRMDGLLRRADNLFFSKMSGIKENKEQLS